MDKRSDLIRRLRAQRAKKAATKPPAVPKGLNPPADPHKPPRPAVPRGWGSVGGGSEKFARPVYGEHRVAGLPGVEQLHPEEQAYLTGIKNPNISNIKGLKPVAPASDAKIAAIHSAVTSSVNNVPGPLPTQRELQAAGRGGESVRGTYEEGGDTLSKYLDSPEVHEKFVTSHLTHPVFKHILEEHGSPLAFAWGLFSAIASPQAKWEQHTRGATALLASWAEHGFHTDDRTLSSVISSTRGRTYGGATNKPWNYILAPGDKQAKLKTSMRMIGDVLRSYATGSPDRTMLSQSGWKAKNFADSSHPGEYRDPESAAIDYMMGLATTPNMPQLASAFASVLGKGGRASKNPKSPSFHRGTVASMIDDVLKSEYGIHTGIQDAAKMSSAEKAQYLPGIPLHGVVESLVSESARLGDPTYKMHMKHVFNTMKKAQGMIWADPAMGLAYKMAVAHAARTMPLKPGEAPWKPIQLQECVWSLIAAILSTRDLAGTTKINNIADSLTHEAVRFNWDILGTLNNGTVADELVRLGLSRGSVEAFKRDCEASFARRGARFSGRISGIGNPDFASIGRRIQPGQNAGGSQGRKELTRLRDLGYLHFDPDSFEASMNEGPKFNPAFRMSRMSRMSRLKAIADGVIHLRNARKAAPTPAAAMAVARSRNALALANTMSKTLHKLGIDPHKVSRAIHSYNGQASPAAIASVFSDAPPEAAIQGAAWQGLMTKSPGMVAFYADPAGPDMMHRVILRGPTGDLSQRLAQAGASSSTIVPTRQGAVAYVYDEGGRLRERLARSGLEVESAPGRGAMIGSRSPAKGRQEMRDIIRAGSQGAGEDQSPVPPSAATAPKDSAPAAPARNRPGDRL